MVLFPSVCFTRDSGHFFTAMPPKRGNKIVLPAACLKNIHKKELLLTDEEFKMVQDEIKRLFGQQWKLVKPERAEASSRARGSKRTKNPKRAESKKKEPKKAEKKKEKKKGDKKAKKDSETSKAAKPAKPPKAPMAEASPSYQESPSPQSLIESPSPSEVRELEDLVEELTEQQIGRISDEFGVHADDDGEGTLDVNAMSDRRRQILRLRLTEMVQENRRNAPAAAADGDATMAQADPVLEDDAELETWPWL
eukprot:s2353_g10.t1